VGRERAEIFDFASNFARIAIGLVIAFALSALPLTQVTAAETAILRLTQPITSVGATDGLGTGFGMSEPQPSVLLTASDKRKFLLLMEDGTFTTTAFVRQLPGPGRRPDMLPDGDVTVGVRNISEAWLTMPTDRYRHGILGDGLEAGGLAVRDRDGRVWQLALDEQSVFEDRRARLVDLDTDGGDEILVVRSYADGGAALAVLGLGLDGLGVIAETPPIGTPRRWLNPIGAADFDGDGVIEIAYVETPHIGGTLTLYEFDHGELVLDFIVGGFSNHEIGSYKLNLSAIVDWDRDGIVDLAIPSANRHDMRIISFAGGRAQELESIALEAPIKTDIVVTDLDDNRRPELIFGIDDGRLIWIQSEF